MSAVYKRLERRDAFISPYTAHKTFTFSSASFGEVGLEWIRGVSGSFPYDKEAVAYAGIKQIMFDSYGQTSTEFNWENPLEEEVNVLSIPRNLYGLSIMPGSFSLEYADGPTLIDDNGLILSGSTIVGRISYSKGLVALTNGGYADESAIKTTFTTSTNNYAATQQVYIAEREVVTLDPLTNPNPFIPTADPTRIITYNDPTYDFNNDYIYGFPDAQATLGNAPNLAPRLTITFGGISKSLFATHINLDNNGELQLTFPEDITHPSLGLVDLSLDSQYNQINSIELEWKKTATDGVDVERGYIGSGSWGTEALTYPSTSATFDLLDDYSAVVDPLRIRPIKRYIQDISEVASTIIELESSSLNYHYTDIDFTASFQSSQPILTHNYHCMVEPNEMNLSHNPTLLDKGSDISGSLKPEFLEEDFRVYTTTIGLYNDFDELVAVGKLSEPTPILPNTPYTFVVKIDL